MSIMDWYNQQKASAQDVLKRYKNKDFMEAVVAACALVSSADGKVDPTEKQKMVGYIERSEDLKIFDIKDVIKSFKSYTDNFEFDFTIGKGEALKAVGKIKANAEASRLLIRICCAIGLADGDFAAPEKAIIKEICQELKLNPAEFEL